MFHLSGEAIDEVALSRQMANSGAGAFVVFEGRVRDHNDGRVVTALEYEAFDALALKEGRRIVQEAIERFHLIEVLAVHRTGTLSIGETAVWVGVLAEHRAEGFDGCRFIIDEIKHRVPVWKKEHYIDGTSEWANCSACRGENEDQESVRNESGGRQSHSSGLGAGSRGAESRQNGDS